MDQALSPSSPPAALYHLSNDKSGDRIVMYSYTLSNQEVESKTFVGKSVVRRSSFPSLVPLSNQPDSMDLETSIGRFCYSESFRLPRLKSVSSQDIDYCNLDKLPNTLLNQLRIVSALRSLSHDNLFTAYRPVVVGESWLCFTLALPRQSLRDVIGSGALTKKHTALFTYQIMRGLKYLHSASLVHANLSSSCIAINTEDLSLKIAGFLNCETASMEETYASQVSGYTAPEQLLARSQTAAEQLLACSQTAAVDLWAAGCLLAEMLTKQLLFEGGTEMGLLLSVTQVIHLSNEDWSRVLRLMPNKLLKNHPFRPRSPLCVLLAGHDLLAAQLVEALLSFSAELRPSASSCLAHSYLGSWHCLDDEPSYAGSSLLLAGLLDETFPSPNPDVISFLQGKHSPTQGTHSSPMPGKNSPSFPGVDGLDECGRSSYDTSARTCDDVADSSFQNCKNSLGANVWNASDWTHSARVASAELCDQTTGLPCSQDVCSISVTSYHDRRTASSSRDTKLANFPDSLDSRLISPDAHQQREGNERSKKKKKLSKHEMAKSQNSVAMKNLRNNLDRASNDRTPSPNILDLLNTSSSSGGRESVCSSPGLDQSSSVTADPARTDETESVQIIARPDARSVDSKLRRERSSESEKEKAEMSEEKLQEDLEMGIVSPVNCEAEADVVQQTRKLSDIETTCSLLARRKLRGFSCSAITDTVPKSTTTDQSEIVSKADPTLSNSDDLPAELSKLILPISESQLSVQDSNKTVLLEENAQEREKRNVVSRDRHQRNALNERWGSRKLILDKIESEKDRRRNGVERAGRRGMDLSRRINLTSEEFDDLYRLPTDHLRKDRQPGEVERSLVHFQAELRELPDGDGEKRDRRDKTRMHECRHPAREACRDQRSQSHDAWMFSEVRESCSPSPPPPLSRPRTELREERFHMEGACGGLDYCCVGEEPSFYRSNIELDIEPCQHLGAQTGRLLAGDRMGQIVGAVGLDRGLSSSPESPVGPLSPAPSSKPKKSPKKHRAV